MAAATAAAGIVQNAPAAQIAQMASLARAAPALRFAATQLAGGLAAALLHNFVLRRSKVFREVVPRMRAFSRELEQQKRRIAVSAEEAQRRVYLERELE